MEKTCEGCGRQFDRPGFRGAPGARITPAVWARRRFCSHGCAMLGQRHPNWQGGRQIARGYVRVWLPPDHRFASMRSEHGYRVLEHRLVMAEFLGRPLNPSEQVHHRNGDRQDNRIENLELRVGNHGKGATASHCATCTCFDH